VTVDERHVAGLSRKDHAFALDQMERCLESGCCVAREKGPPPLIPPVKEAPMDLIPTRDEILRGDTTDIYFRRTMEVLRADRGRTVCA